MSSRGLLVPVLLACSGPALAQCALEHSKQVVGGAQANSFSWQLDLCGDTLIVGAPGSLEPVALVHERDADGLGEWGEVARLVPSDALMGEAFGYDVIVDGARAFVSALAHVHGGTQAGAVYAFERDAGGLWNEVAELLPPVPSTFHGFGIELALEGDQLIVAAFHSTTGGAHSFRRSAAGEWLHHQFLPQSNAASVALDGDELLVSGSAEARMYRLDPSTADWTLVTTLQKPPATGSSFGISVDLGGGLALVGDPTAGGASSGRAFVYRRHKGGPENWGLAAELAPFVPANAHFGVQVVLDANRILVTATLEDLSSVGIRVGAAYLYRRAAQGAGQWELLTRLHASMPGPSYFFGYSADIDGGTIAVGTYQSVPGVVDVFDWNRAGEGSYCGSVATANGCRARVCTRGSASATSPSGFELLASGVEGGHAGMFFYSVGGAGPPVLFGAGNGLLCMQPPFQRLEVQPGSGVPGTCAAGFVRDLNAFWTERPELRPAPGVEVAAQLWFQAGGTAALSDAVRFTVGP